MAEPTLRTPENVPGAYYVDETCIDCDQCRSQAPEFFRRLDSSGYTVVHRQPQTPAELVLAEEALEGCPSESIGNNGVAQPTIAELSPPRRGTASG